MTTKTNRTYITTGFANEYILLESEPTWCVFCEGAQRPYDEGRTDCEDYREDDPDDVCLIFGFVSSEGIFKAIWFDDVVDNEELIARLDAAVDGKDECAKVTTPRYAEDSWAALTIELDYYEVVEETAFPA